MEYPVSLPVGRRWRMALWVTPLLAVFPAHAAELDVSVLDRYGRPVPNVAVYIQPDPDERPVASTNLAEMNLEDIQFAPQLLVVQTGTRVQFPNNDQIAHHVYSFSKPNSFVLPMFKGNMRPHVEFDAAGIVTIGCNLHDHMVGYVLVVDGPAFGTTGPDGRTRLLADNPEGLSVSIWSPRIRLDDENLTQTVKAGRSARLTFLLTEELRASHNGGSEALSWNEN
jgi:plastocyanin